MDGITKYVNKYPIWNTDVNAYVLDFGGRV